MVKQERAARTRESLIRSAAEVFDQEGFAVASLTAISSHAGVSNGALHFHFASKAALADAVEDSAVLRLRAIMESAVRGANLQRLVDASHRLAHELRNDVVLRAGFQLCGDPALEPRADMRGQWQTWVEETLKRADHEGELRETVSVQGAATAVVAATVGFEVLGMRDGEWLSRQTITRFWELMLPLLASVAMLGELQSEGVL
ncbi:ScbR family autoregulator-binding transcription factor [Streptomyces sp. NPDC054794]